MPSDPSDHLDAGSLKFPVLEETVTVHKTLADNGGVRLRKLVHEEVVEVDEPLAAQSVKLTRMPVGRDVDGPVDVRYENGVTIIPVVEERLVIRRQRVLVEEIHLTGTSHTHRVPQSVTLRREEVIVERQAPGSGTWSPEEPTSRESPSREPPSREPPSMEPASPATGIPPGAPPPP